MNIDAQINAYFDNKSKQSSDPLDSQINGFFSKQQNDPHPLDDSYVAKAQADTGDQSYNGYCEMFVEKAAGLPNMGQTAAQAWDNYQQQGKAVNGNVDKAPRGALIYFDRDKSNWGDGHVGFADGAGNLVSATSQGVKSIPLAQWQQITGQKPLGYVIPN